MTIVSLVIVIPVALYIILSSDWVLNKIKIVGENELNDLLGTEVTIGNVSFSPFNRLMISDIKALDDNDSIALAISNVDIRFEFWDFVLRQKIVIDYATLSGLDLKLYRDSIGAPLNIANIIERLKKPDEEKKESKFRLRLNDISIDDCRLTYDVLSEPETPERFNPSHISIDGLCLTAFAPVVSNDHYNVRLRSLRFREASGFSLDELKANVDITQSSVLLSDLTVILPNSNLAFGELKAPIDSMKAISHIVDEEMINVRLLEGSHVYLPDIKYFVPALGDFDYDLYLSMNADANLDSIDINHLNISDPEGVLDFEAKGSVGGFRHLSTLTYSDVEFALSTDTIAINQVLRKTNARVSPFVRRIIGNVGHSRVQGKADGTMEKGVVDVDVRSNLAHATMKGSISKQRGSLPYNFKGLVKVDSLLLGRLIADDKFGKVSAEVDIESSFSSKNFDGNFEATIPSFGYKGYVYKGISAKASILPASVTADVNINDKNISTYLTGHWEKQEDNQHSIDAYMIVNEFRIDSLRISNNYPGYDLTGVMHIEGQGESIDKFSGNFSLSDVKFKDKTGSGIQLKAFNIKADNYRTPGRISVISDYINGAIDGNYKFTTLVPEVKEILKSLLPAIFAEKRQNEATDEDIVVDEGNQQALTPNFLASNKFDFNFTISKCESICDFFKLPVTLIDKASLYGTFDGPNRFTSLKLDIPWLGQGDNIIEDTSLAVNLEGASGEGGVYVTSMMPTKKGNMDISANVDVDDGHIDTKIFWTIKRAIPINGHIDFTTIFNRDTDNNLITQINFNPGKINFGDDIWSIGESMITYGNDRALINNFTLSSTSQNVSVNGVAGPSETDELQIKLSNIQLIDIFETLEIDNALISGHATGTIDAAGILGKNPLISSKRLKVRSIGYNYCTLGDADVVLSVDDRGKMFNFSADITQPMGYKSKLSGYIEPSTEGLNLNIDADHVKVGFMKPFMKAFTSDVDGFASGKAQLYGTFKNIDLKGDIFVEDLKIKIDFTNTYYYTSDSIHIRPGQIDLKNITIKDEYGHTALLNGWVAHEFFHNATFDFAVTNARRLLSYNVTEKQSPQWFGRIFANGSATVKGGSSSVDIGVNMSTADNSTFTFVLSDSEEAGEYSFITFRDVTERPYIDPLEWYKSLPERVRQAKIKADNPTNDSQTAYNMDINIDVSPQAQINIVMDPVGGDKIRAYGSGHLRMTYGSINNDLHLYGTYTLERGSYNFTLQDIILKDFIIKEGSSISFTGNPYNAELDINAYYQTNANLSDLDDSFLEDKELNRTNVQVRAIMMVKGDMLQPDITFDLEFPTLTQDIYRKVRSIISTEDMMNRQIIYLLALNRFYTPEYMASTTKGNELFSVASSTISSQLSSMLGKLSDNWSIAPNLRSDRGDFSDLEVDLTLTSSLLNNRLLFNGNFGYRDKSLNTNQFVGDFDLEYLLDRSGEWRLKAYNRYNDQNYYLRTAQTTQGIGIVYRRDFDKTFRFLKHIFPKRDKVPVDTVKIPADTIKLTVDTIIQTIEIDKVILPDTTKSH